MRWPLLTLAALTLALLGLFAAAPVALANHNPDPPTNLRATSRTQNQIAIAWDAPSDLTDVSEYWVRHKPASQSNWIPGSFIGVGETKVFEFRSLSQGTTYDIEARSCQNLTFNHCSSTPATLQVTTLVPLADYDADDDGLIEVANLAQLNAIRWDLDGDGSPASANAADYATAFPNAATTPGNLGCPSTGCAGYELTANLDFDENNDGEITETGDPTWWNSGAGWAPIGDNTTPYNAIFDGNRHTIANLFIKRDDTDFNGVFGVIGSSGIVRNVGVVGANISGTSSTKGALAGRNDGAISNSYATGITITDAPSAAGGLVGRLTGSITDSYATGITITDAPSAAGGLVGRLTGSITDSYASATVEAGDGDGGLVGHASELSTITRSYATGSASGRQNIGGLVGHVGHILGSATPNDGVVTSSYATGAVTASGRSGGGLIGFAEDARIVASYATGPVTAPIDAGGLVGGLDASSTVTDSYYDTDTSGQSVGTGPKTTTELQSPTGYNGIYANWRNIDLDGDPNTADTNDFWHFGTNSQYPVIKTDFNGDNTASWPEFGYQLREAPRLR